MHIDTPNNSALKLVKEAQTSITLYQQSKELERLEDAKANLEKALKKDKDYLRARFWRGLVNDLMGDTDEAVQDLAEVKKAVSALEPSVVSKGGATKRGQEVRNFLSVVEYNLGVAHFHKYSRAQVDKAIKTFADLIEQTTNSELRLRAKAWLAKAYALRMIPKPPPIDPEKGTEFYERAEDFEKVTKFYESPEPKKNVGEYFKLSKEVSDAVIAEVETRGDLERAAADDIRGVAYDARAVALMFHTDYDDKDRIRNLEEALKALNTADACRPRDWAIYSNFGSVHMRLGHWRQVAAEKTSGPEASKLKQQSQTNFEKALEYLKEVVTGLRPGYGFALYEEGRTYRLMKDFDKAKKKFDRALEVKKNRDVSDSRIKFEKERAKRRLTTFP